MANANPNHKVLKQFSESLHREVELLEGLNAVPALRWDKIAQSAVQSRVVVVPDGDSNLKRIDMALDLLRLSGSIFRIDSASVPSPAAGVSTRLEFFGKLFAGACSTYECNGAVKLAEFQDKFLRLSSLVRQEDWQPTLNLLTLTDFVCPSIKKDQDFLIPSMFSLQKPDGVDDHINELVDKKRLEGSTEPERARALVQVNCAHFFPIFLSCFLTVSPDMPDGLFSRILTKALREGESSLFWRNGAVFIPETFPSVVALLEWRNDKTPGIAVETTSYFAEQATEAFTALQTLVENTIKAAPGVKVIDSRLAKRSSFKLKRGLSRTEDKAADGIVSPRSPSQIKKTKQKRSTGDLFTTPSATTDDVTEQRSSSRSKKRSMKSQGAEDKFDDSIAGGEVRSPSNPGSGRSSATNSPSRARTARSKSSSALLQGGKITPRQFPKDV